MGVFPLVARVGCLRGGAIRLLEEWSPIPARGGQNPAYRPSGNSLTRKRVREMLRGLLVVCRAFRHEVGSKAYCAEAVAGPLPHHEAGVGSPGANLGPRSPP